MSEQLSSNSLVGAALAGDRPKDRPETSPVDGQWGAEINSAFRKEAEQRHSKRTADETDAKQDLESVMEYADTPIQDDSK